MHGIKLFLAAALLGASLAASADPQIDVAHEVVANTMTLPKSDTGTLLVQGCSSCATFRFELTARTVYQIGEENVSLQTLREAFAARPNTLTLLLLTEDRRSVERIKIAEAH
ncbi:MAG TPA: hypothetical protein VFV88_04585 [Steroidobacteraceae bacterium]|nr:hypothetical protein [Steroidobacteraceae bacterium]